MKLTPNQQKAIVTFRQADRPLRTSEILERGVHRRDLYALRDAGILERISRGVYRLADMPPLTEPDLVTVASRIPKAVICLVSALRFHGITEEIPRAVSIALPRGTAQPVLNWPPLAVFRFSGEAFTMGVETHSIDNVSVHVYGVAKTVADCFRFRNRIGVDVAVDALRRGLRERLFTPAEFMRFVKICRVSHVVRPYLEAIL